MQILYGTQLRHMRKMRRLRLSAVASMSGLHVSYLSRIETNVRPAPALSLRESIYKALALSVSEELLLEEVAQRRTTTLISVPDGFGAIIVPQSALIKYFAPAGLPIKQVPDKNKKRRAQM